MQKTFAGKHNRSYRSVIKNIITKGANVKPIKACEP